MMVNIAVYKLKIVVFYNNADLLYCCVEILLLLVTSSEIDVSVSGISLLETRRLS